MNNMILLINLTLTLEHLNKIKNITDPKDILIFTSLKNEIKSVVNSSTQLNDVFNSLNHYWNELNYLYKRYINPNLYLAMSEIEEILLKYYSSSPIEPGTIIKSEYIPDSDNAAIMFD
jgi:hypothetical protein